MSARTFWYAGWHDRTFYLLRGRHGLDTSAFCAGFRLVG